MPSNVRSKIGMWAISAIIIGLMFAIAQSETPLTLVQTYPVVLVMLVVAGGFTASGLVMLLRGWGTTGHSEWRSIPWGANWRRVNWRWFALSTLLLGAAMLDTEGRFLPQGGLSAVAVVIPLVMGMQAAAAFGIDDEPGLEMLLATPYGLRRIIVGRLLLVVIGQALIALIGGVILLITRPEQDATLLLGWIPPAIFMAGLGLWISLRSRMMIAGIIISGGLWLVFTLFAAFFVPGQPTIGLLRFIQPFLWPFHLQATPDLLGAEAFAINRLFLLLAGLAMVTAALREIGDDEQVLLNPSGRSRRNAVKEVAVGRSVTPVQAIPRVWAQILSIAGTEARMHGRRRPVRVIALTLLLGGFVTMMFITITSATALVPGMPTPDSLPPDLAAILRGNWIVLTLAGLFLLLLAAVMPVLLADAVPIDEQLQMTEMLRSLPIPAWAYLLGKVLGVWLVIGISVGGAALLLGLIYALNGVYDPIPLLDLVLISGGFLLISSGGLCVLIGATQSTRLRAALLVLVIVVVLGMLPIVAQSEWVKWVVPQGMTLIPQTVMHNLTAIAAAPLERSPSILEIPEMPALFAGGIVQLIAWGSGVAIWWRRRWS